jgi:hypothetical protein
LRRVERKDDRAKIPNWIAARTMTAPVASNRHGPTAKLVDSAGFVEIAMAWTTASMRSFAT